MRNLNKSNVLTSTESINRTSKQKCWENKLVSLLKAAQFTKAPQFTNHTKDYDWETLAQHRTIAHLRALLKVYSVEQAWKATSDRLRKPYYLSRVDHVQKIRDRKQRTDIRKYSFVNRTIKNWNQLPAEALGTFSCKPKIFKNRVRKAIICGIKRRE